MVITIVTMNMESWAAPTLTHDLSKYTIPIKVVGMLVVSDLPTKVVGMQDSKQIQE